MRADSPVLSLDQIASKWKIMQYGQGGLFGIECQDRNYIDEKIKVRVAQKGAFA